MKKNLYIGGYSILDLNDTNVYKQALICAEQNKPVLVYDDPLRYYADTIAIDTDNDNNVIITKGGKTITIANDNTITTSGNIQEKLHLYQVRIQGKIGADDVDFRMNIYSNKELKTGEVLPTDLELTYELNKYEETFIYDNNNIIKTIAVYEDIYVDNDALEFNFYDDEGETSFATGTTSVSITKVF